MKIQYEKVIPYPFDVVLSQYFDYEHIEHVHPDTLGSYRVVENNGNEIVYEQLWPRKLWQRKSLVRQTYDPPGDIRFEFIGGLHKGIVVETRLSECEEGTLVDETYIMPSLPDWNWLKKLVRPGVLRSVNRIWDEDLDVGVCIDGLPRVPGAPPAKGISKPELEETGVWVSVCNETEFSNQDTLCKTVQGTEVLIIRHNNGYRALESRCPHTGGPLALGKWTEETITCPWHGACFQLETGKVVSGPSPRKICIFPVRLVDDWVEVQLVSGLRTE